MNGGTPSPFALHGRHALVIGGGSGIGRAIALGLAQAGADVAVAGRRPQPLHDTCALLQSCGVQARAFPADATDLAQLDALVAQYAQAAGGAPDVLVNAQGVMSLGPAEDLAPADYDRVMDTNVRSMWFACTRFGRGMLARGSGCVVNIASLAGYRGMPRNGIYAVSKFGVRGLTESLAAEWSGRGVRVNAIAPGFFLTDLNRDSLVGERQARALSRVPMGRLGELHELAGAAVYLASPAASYVTGVTLPVDGGFLALGL